MLWGRKDAFPGADGSTIQQIEGRNATTITIYGGDGTTTLTEDKTGYKKVDITTVGVISGNNSQIYTIMHPLTFIVSASDWYTTISTYQSNVLWGEGTRKSNYDPCPYGWRIPTDSEKTWGDFSTTSAPHYHEGTLSSAGEKSPMNGRLYNRVAWYPSSGTRYGTSGNLYYVGHNACFWSSSVHEENAKRLYYHMENIFLNSTASRAHSYSVRCVQE